MIRILYILFLGVIISCNNKQQKQPIVEDTLTVRNSVNSTITDTIQKSIILDSNEIYLSNHLANVDSFVLVSRTGKKVNEDLMAVGVPIVLNGHLNSKIIINRINISGKSLDTLIQILLRSITEPVGKTRCGGFNPHYSILISRKERYSYIDICFHCQEFETSADLSRLAFDEKKWAELENFFIERGINPNTRH